MGGGGGGASQSCMGLLQVLATTMSKSPHEMLTLILSTPALKTMHALDDDDLLSAVRSAMGVLEESDEDEDSSSVIMIDAT